MFELLLTVAAAAAGGIAAVSGFGIGSILTPLLALHADAKLAVAAVSIPHLLATLVRFLYLREHVNRRVVINFGVLSAVGGACGALLNAYASSPFLKVVLAVLLIFAGTMGLAGLAERMRFGRRAAWVAGAISGALGGLVGNQGGIRSAAMLGFGLGRDEFVATATGIALVVDFARMPVYFAASGSQLLAAWPVITFMSAGVLFGTVFGARALRRIPERLFRRIVSLLILALGIYLITPR